MKFEKRVEDYHMGTLLRLDCNEDISEKNTCLGEYQAFSDVSLVGRKLNTRHVPQRAHVFERAIPIVRSRALPNHGVVL